MMMIISSAVSEEKRGELIKKFSKMASAETFVEKLGMRKFATPINYRTEGFYVLMHFECEPGNIKKMQDLLVITEGVERFMFVTKNEKQLEADRIRRAKRAEKREAMAAEKTQAEK